MDLWNKLQNLPLLQSLTEKQAEKIVAMDWLSRIYPAQKRIAFRGDSLERLQVLVKGSLSAEITSLKGKTLKVEVLEAPAIIAGPLLFAKENYLPVDLICVNEVEILSLNRDQALELLGLHPHVLGRFLEDCGNKITFLSEKIRLFQHSSLRVKIALYLLDQRVKQKSERIKLPMKMEFLAELFSVARPSLSRSLSELVDEGYLEREGKLLIISDPEDLKALIEEES